ncbi:heat stress transcription factor A-3 [Gossypium arboreum]|uniref:heat stress transcription factor A-3 n=1 Tax=Gossypium arboreum TaxID=29729 RepID=UPI0022F17F08|nr:heat stress transcription factor A-3 [Gossypium arboreum]
MNPDEEKRSQNALPNPPQTSPFSSSLMELETFSCGVPQPLEILQGNPVPPFLSKTFDLVEDTSLDPIISWGPTGESFVVWDPVEFSKFILPRNFKHNNFSSFVRQLNTYVGLICKLEPFREQSRFSHLFLNHLVYCFQGFRKIDTDKWEFANEAFQRGKRYLLKNIQRRKSPQSQQFGNYFGSSTEAGRSGVEGEIERLRKEKSMLMQEVVELQQEQQGTARHVEVVNQRLQSAEQRQKQMVSFLAKLFQNPAFLARLRQKKEQGEISSSRMRRKFVKHQLVELIDSETPAEGQIVKYSKLDWRDIAISPSAPDIIPTSVEQSPDYLPKGVAETDLGSEGFPFPVDDEVVVSDELATAHGFLGTPELVGEGSSGTGIQDLKGKNVIGSEQVVNPGYFISSPEDLVKQKSTPYFSSPISESVSKQDVWSMDFDATVGMPSSRNELWGNLETYDIPELGVTGELSDVWDLGFLQAAEDSGADKWPTEGYPFDNPHTENQGGQSEANRSKKMDP